MKIRKQDISETDIFITTLLLVFTAVFVFGFFSLLTDAIRYVSFKPMDKSLIFSAEYRIYFNVFFAGLGVLLGQSFALYYLLSRSSLKSYYKTQILNDNQWVIWSVLLLIMKGIAILVSYRMIFQSNELVKLIPTIIYIMLTILIVLFIYSWNGLRRYLIGTRFKVLVGGLIGFFVLSYSIAHIEFIDRAFFDQWALSKNAVYTHDIHYPKSEWAKKIMRKSLIHDFVIGKNPKTQNVEVFYETRLVSLDKMDRVIYEIMDSHRVEELKWLTIGLRIDKDILVKELLPIFDRFSSNYFANRFAIYIEGEDDKVFSYRFNSDLLYDYVKDDSLMQKDSISNIQIPLPPRPPLTIVHYYRENSSIDIYTTPKGVFLKDDELFTVASFTNKLREEVKAKGQRAVTSYFIDVNIPFGTYIETKGQIFRAYYILREEYALTTYTMSYDALDKDEQRAVRKEYPINIIEYGLNNLTEKRLSDFYEEQKEKSLNTDNGCTMRDY